MQLGLSLFPVVFSLCLVEQGKKRKLPQGAKAMVQQAPLSCHKFNLMLRRGYMHTRVLPDLGP